VGLAKRIGKNEALRGLLCWLTAQYVRLVFLTSRWDVVGGDIPAAFWSGGRPFILAFWHGRILMMPKSWRGSVPIHMLISQHRDGQLIARTVGHLGIQTVAGSTTRGGAAALRAMFKVLKSGNCIGITPDGPRGPRMRASLGVISIARVSGCPIIPVALSASRGRFLSTWDRFLVPLPFSRGVFVWGSAIDVPADGSAETLENLRRTLETSLLAITVEADSRMGRTPVEPAPARGEGAA
jgi:lysophospholipid acyltransferase (LPLAT)-like uncharacterized protein